ncbi:MAG: NAD(P)/FAD-dependent oxidoreductase [Pseudomonadota bacterium]|nr:NAD(P)/FAD-dependent oxidoreductase [Pseudomonadota bacterium]
MNARSDIGRPFDADDETIRKALEVAHIPALMNALVHITGDPSIIRGAIRPKKTLFRDPQAGIDEAGQAEVRALAFDLLRAWRDAGAPDPVVPGPDLVREMLTFIIGQQVSDDYVEFLSSELGMYGEDPFAHAPLDAIPAAQRAGFHVLVIGAGMSGLLAAIRLKAEGIGFTIVERHADVGGTWFANTYPGCRVDSPNHTYSYSFAPNDWPQHFSTQPVLLDYFRRVADEQGIRENVRCSTEVTAARFDEATGLWTATLRTADGREETVQANAIISAAGQLRRPKYPDVPGRDSFAGPSFHSAEWRHDVDLTGRRVIVIGTGASAFQFVPEIAKQAADITIFQRTPPWQIPTPEYHDYISAEKHWLLNTVPFYARWFRFWMFWTTTEGLLPFVSAEEGWNGDHNTVSAMNEQLRQMLTLYMTQLCGGDDDLRAKVIPDYPPGGKRMLRDNGNWMRALARDNVQVETDRIVEVVPEGVRTADGRVHKADVLIYGTGFDADGFLKPMRITGRGGVDLHEHWDGDARAYLGITAPGFPNLFMLYGPNTNIVVNGSIIFYSECEVRYVMGCLKLLLEGGHRALDCRTDVHDRYNAEIDAANARMAWGAPSVRSWYKNAKGRVTQNWPFSQLQFWQRTRQPDPADFEML